MMLWKPTVARNVHTSTAPAQRPTRACSLQPTSAQDCGAHLVENNKMNVKNRYFGQKYLNNTNMVPSHVNVFLKINIFFNYFNKYKVHICLKSKIKQIKLVPCVFQTTWLHLWTQNKLGKLWYLNKPSYQVLPYKCMATWHINCLQ